MKGLFATDPNLAQGQDQFIRVIGLMLINLKRQRDVYTSAQLFLCGLRHPPPRLSSSLALLKEPKDNSLTYIII